MATAEQARDFVPSVDVATVKASPATFSVTLPGTTAAFAAANIFARATGYISKRNVDIGDHVKAGDQVILNPPVTLVDGSKVQPRPDAAASDR